MLPALFGVVIGMALGLTGGGGSIFAVPLLVYGLGVAPHEAVAVSLAAVAATAASGALPALRSGLVEYRAGAIFAAGGVFAAPFGVRIGHALPGATVMTAFGSLMLVVAALMWRKAGRLPQEATVVRAGVAMDDGGSDGGPVCRLSPERRLRLTAPCGIALTVVGALTGVLSGLFGVGGGFVIVPALTFISELDIHRAVSTSLFVITVVATSAVASLILGGQALPWKLTLFFMLGGCAGMGLGRVLAGRLAGPTLQRCFAATMVGVAVLVVYLSTR